MVFFLAANEKLLADKVAASQAASARSMNKYGSWPPVPRVAMSRQSLRRSQSRGPLLLESSVTCEYGEPCLD
jgi:hypothetical protein